MVDYRNRRLYLVGVHRLNLGRTGVRNLPSTQSRSSGSGRSNSLRMTGRNHFCHANPTFHGGLMKNPGPWLFCCLLLTTVKLFDAQSWSQQGEQYHDLATPQVRSGELAPPRDIRNYLVEGKLRLSLRDALVLTLENNSGVRIQETQVESSKFVLLGAHQPFDPVLTSSYNLNNSTFPPFTALQGTGGLNVNVKNKTQTAQFAFTETFETGTNVQVGLNRTSNSANNDFFLFNPYVTSALNFQFTQPLLRNAWF